MTAVVVPDTGELTVLMSEDEANTITLKIKQYAGVICSLVKEAHDKQAWRALGYPTWTAYCKAEFNIGKSRSYQLVKYAEVIALGTDTTGLPESTIVDSLPEGTARTIDPAVLVDALTEAFHAVPADAPVATRGELLAAVLEQIKPDQSSDAGVAPLVSDEPGEPSHVPSAHPPHGENAQPATVDSDAPEAGTDGDIPPSGADGRGEPVPPLVPPTTVPTLPCTWRDDLACAAYLLRYPVAVLADAMNEDDAADLQALQTHLVETLAIYQAIKEQA